MAERIPENDNGEKNFDISNLLSNKVNLAVIGLFFVGLFLLAFGAGMFLLKGSSDDDIRIISSEENESTSSIVVHVDGAVNVPGVYELGGDSRVNDLVLLAGGLSDDANLNALNLAAKLADGQKLFLPRVGESASGGTVTGQQSSGLINVNTASESQLDTLPGVGPVTAGKIIASRPYSAPGDLLSKKAVGSATFEKIKDLITVY